MPIELLSMGGSALLGFVFKFMANAQQDRHDQMMAISNATREARADENGVWPRRFIVFVMMSLLSFIVVAPALLEGVNTVVVDQGWFFTTTTEIKGIVYDETIKSILISIIGFYFGGAAANRT